MNVPKTSDYMQIKIKMPNPSQEPLVSSKAQNQDLEDMDVLCTFTIKVESKNMDNRCIKDQKSHTNQYSKSGLKGHGCSLHHQNKIKMKIKNPTQEPSTSSRAPNQDLKDMDVLCTFKIKIRSQTSEHGCIKDM